MSNILKSIKYIIFISVFILPIHNIFADSGSFRQTTFNLDKGDTFSLEVLAEDLHNASMIDLTIEYDPNVITYQSFSEGDFTDTSSMFGVLTSASDNGGMERRLFSIPCDAKSDGDGTLITISFLASSTPGTTNIQMVGLNVLHPDFSNTTGTTGADAVVNISDDISPEISITSPTSTDTYSFTSANNTLAISGTASDNVSVSSVTYSVDTGDSGNANGTTSWSANVSLTPGDNILTVTATDASGNTNTDTLTITYSVPDTVAPNITSTSPSGTLESSTRQTTLSVTTDENAICHYSGTENIDFEESQEFSNTGGQNHSTTIDGLENGESYTYYIKCRDTLGNTNNSDTQISFSVKSHSSGGGGGGGGGGSSSRKDTTAPTNVSVKINNNAKKTLKRLVTLKLTAKDRSRPIRFQVSNSNDFDEKHHRWIRFRKKYRWQLESGNGIKTVYVRFKDSKGNISKTVFDDIVLVDTAKITKNKTKIKNKIKRKIEEIKNRRNKIKRRIVKGASTYKFMRNIKLGTKNNDVIELQKKLREHGYFNYPTNTGYFGKVTLQAVRKYQKDHGIDQTGFVGPITRKSLNDLTQEHARIAGKKDEVSAKEIINLFLALGIIPKEKESLALAAVSAF